MKIREQTDQSKQKDDMKNWTSEKITDQIQRQWLDALKTKSNYDRLLEMNLKHYGFLDDNDEEREKLENLKIDFNIVQHLKDLYPKLSMENVYFLYSNNDIDKIFEDENVLTLKNMSKYLIFGLVVSLIINIISNQVLKGSFSLGFKLTDIIIIIFVSIVSCIIENGVKTNKKND